MFFIKDIFNITPDDNSKVFCVFHNADLDGWSSGILVKKYFELNNFNMNYFIPVPYNWEEQILIKETNKSINILKVLKSNDIVIFVDISPFEMENYDNLFLKCNNVKICDHHETTIKKLEENIELNKYKGVVTRDKSGCQCAYEFLYGNNEEPVAVTLIGDYDRWNYDGKYEFLKLRQFQEGVRTIEGFSTSNLNNDIKLTDFLVKPGYSIDKLDYILNRGEIIINSTINRNKSIFKYNSFNCSIKIKNKIIDNICVCTDYNNNSFLFEDGLGNHELYENTHNGYLLIRPNIKNKSIVSLFIPLCNNTINAQYYMELLGGGGHIHAAGAHCNYKYYKIPSNKLIRLLYKIRFKTDNDILYLY
jgi:oligoribonuclease NrnB/cAMP/cGMP phosphodiesterase (DHH superfamily)